MAIRGHVFFAMQQLGGVPLALNAREGRPSLQGPDVVRQAGGQNLEGPEICAEYSPGYYAFFFEDPDGNKLEICCRASPVIAE